MSIDILNIQTLGGNTIEVTFNKNVTLSGSGWSFFRKTPQAEYKMDVLAVSGSGNVWYFDTTPIEWGNNIFYQYINGDVTNGSEVLGNGYGRIKNSVPKIERAVFDSSTMLVDMDGVITETSELSNSWVEAVGYISNKYLPANTAGRLIMYGRMRSQTHMPTRGIMGFKTTAGIGGYGTTITRVMIFTNHYLWAGYNVSTSWQLNSYLTGFNLWYSLYRDEAGNFYAQESIDKVIWRTVYTLSVNYTGELWAICNLNSSFGKLLYPNIEGFKDYPAPIVTTPDYSLLLNANIVHYGNSLFAGNMVEDDNVTNIFRTFWPVKNQGNPTFSTHGGSGRWTSELRTPTYIDPVIATYRAGVQNICFVWEMRNHISSGTVTVQQAVDEMELLCNQLTSAGFRVIVLECIKSSTVNPNPYNGNPPTPAYKNDLWRQANELIVTQNAANNFCEGIVTGLMDDPWISNVDSYDVLLDGVHGTRKTYEVVAKKCLNKLLEIL